MKLEDVKSTLDAVLITGEDYLSKDIDYAFSSDLMSDVLAFVNRKTILLTGLINPQVIRTAEMIDLPAIVFVRNKKPDAEIIKLASENSIVLMSTEDTLYTASGKLYSSGLKGIHLNK
jgi:DRTGG domain.